MNPQQLVQQEQVLITRARMLAEKKKAIGTKKNRIGFGMDLVMKLGALLFDILGTLLELIPYIGGLVASIMSIGGDVLLLLGYFFIGVKPIGKGVKGNKTLIVRITAMLTELIPYVNIVPAFSIAVWYTNGVVRKEDREYNKSIDSSLKEIQQEERVLQREMQQFQTLVQQYEETEYNNEKYEAAEQNQIYDEDEQDRMAA